MFDFFVFMKIIFFADRMSALQNMKYYSIVALAMVCLAGAASCGALSQYRKTLVFSQSDLQRHLEAEFPREKKIAVTQQKLLTCVLKNPLIILHPETDRIRLQCDSLCKTPEIGMKEVDFLHGQVTIPGRIACSGELDYRPGQGKFYFERLTVHDFDMPALPERYEDKVRTVLSLAIGTYLNHTPVYTLNEKGWQEDVGRYVLRGVEVRNGTIVVELGLPEEKEI